jgi:hypothetical protein
MDDLLKKQIKKSKQQTKISYILAGTGFALALIFGILWLTSGSMSLDQKLNSPTTKVSLDTIDYESQVSELNEQEATHIKIIDSLTTVLLTLEDTISALHLAGKEALAISNALNEDYIPQMIKNAKHFAETNCSKSLAFLYAAKKVANMEKRTGSSIETIQTMIKKCEANVFGESPSISSE